MDWEDLPTDRRVHIETCVSIAEDFPDGAFMGYMEEKGISVEELIAYSNRHKEDDSDAG